MRKKFASQSSLFNPRALLAFALCSVGSLLTIFGFVATSPSEIGKRTGLASDNATAAAASGWSIVNSPNTSDTQHNYLQAVTCVSASDCWAVGNYLIGTVQQTLIEHWDGTSWVIVPSPNTSDTQSNWLYGVKCVSASECWAVGYYVTATATQTLIQRWNGSTWAIVLSPNSSATQNNFFYDVNCASASNCWAVGGHYNGSANQTLIARWDGTSWTIVSSPNLNTTWNHVLQGVTCTSVSDCWAVGYYVNNSPGRFITQTLIEHWDGTSWAITASSNSLPIEDNYLFAVSCVSASDCWAVGDYLKTDGLSRYPQTLVERWNGTVWAIVNSPNTSATQTNVLFGVACVAASECWAAGYHFSGSGGQTLIQQWDGTSWSIVTSPNTSATESNVLHDITCAATDCWAVGDYAPATFPPVARTLTTHYSASRPTPTSVVSQKTHGTAGTFDTNLPLAGDPGIECRSGGANKEYEVVFTFLSAVTFNGATATPGSGGTGSVSSTSSSPDGTEVTVNLSDVSNEQTLKITLADVNDGTSSGDVSVSTGVLVGDVTSNKIVSNTDVAEVKAQVSSPVTTSNFRNDVNANGIISNTDVSDTKAQVSTSLP